jgi:ornithine cyclodeaminase
MRLISATDLRRALPMSEAVPLMESAFAAITNNTLQTAERQVMKLDQGTGLVMAATAPGKGNVVKMVSVIPGNRARGLETSRGMLFLQDERNGEPLALIDGTALTAWRTAAAVGAATRLLARPQARQGLLIGCGTQARTQVLAMDAVLGLERIEVTGRAMPEAEKFVDEMQQQVSATLCAAAPGAAAVEAADVITAATTSTTPVLDGRRVSRGCHVNGVGSFRADMREFDDLLIGRSRVFVEQRDSAMAEAGELIAADANGTRPAREWTEMGRVVDQPAEGRRYDDEITFFKSAYDLWAARAILDAAQRLNLGTSWPV